MNFISKCSLVFICFLGCEGAKILGIIPTASYSHQITFHPLWRELALKGHNVTVITTDPLNNSSLANLKEIDLSEIYDLFTTIKFYEIISGEPIYFWRIALLLRQVCFELAKVIIEHDEIKKIKNEQFDLVIAEAHFPSIVGFIGHFKCPWIGVSSMESGIQYNVAIGNPAHPVLNPDYNLPLENMDNLNFIERLASLVYRVSYVFLINVYIFPTLTAIYKDVGWNAPPMVEVQNNISMLFVTTHPIFHNLRPLLPNTISIGTGMHFKEPQPLPEDLQKFLDDSKTGVIYFSLGSNVNSNLLTKEFKKAVVEAFAEVPHKVLLKMDGEIEGLSKNVMVRKWMPQQDILRHPNIKLFITQGGLQSLQESVVNGIPLIGIPFFGDQITNVNKMVKKGYGVKVDRRSITKEILVAAIREVITNPSYKETAESMGEIFKDEEIPSLERAVYWTEYVIRHKGAKHLRSPGIGMPAWKYYMLDVMGFLAFVSLTIIVAFCLILKRLVRWLIYLVKGDAKKSRKTKKH
ncbi:UDP-glucosyltransferase 2-like isoform X2 [Diabrotica undecimpunctata]|uniref:UDP-glucosyltransferase 2-like isoform X2 n=1 Tax=Diabrotica undecimpunctata TaxID=50387 RepID=UPI003B63441E